MGGFGKLSYIDFRKIDKKKSSINKESVDDYLSRGGKINSINTKEEIKKQISKDIFSGVNVKTSKLTEKQVIEIRKSNLTNSALSKIYGVNHSTISKVKLRLSWTHIKE